MWHHFISEKFVRVGVQSVWQQLLSRKVSASLSFVDSCSLPQGNPHDNVGYIRPQLGVHDMKAFGGLVLKHFMCWCVRLWKIVSVRFCLSGIVSLSLFSHPEFPLPVELFLLFFFFNDWFSALCLFDIKVATVLQYKYLCLCLLQATANPVLHYRCFFNFLQQCDDVPRLFRL